jgi:hypothetical protein
MARGLKKGMTNNPGGRKKGSKNKLPRGQVEKIIAINQKLDEEGKGLGDCASEDPKWFHSIFTRAIVPKDVNVNLDGELKITWEQ